MLRKRSVGVNTKNYLPCAGITLSRFYGYYLSLAGLNRKAPRGICEMSGERTAANIATFFFLPVTFEGWAPSH
jgi:hypothetical protein